MSILKQDIERYTAYLEFAQDGLNRCHPKDEAVFQENIDAYKRIIDALDYLESLELGRV